MATTKTHEQVITEPRKRPNSQSTGESPDSKRIDCSDSPKLLPLVPTLNLFDEMPADDALPAVWFKALMTKLDTMWNMFISLDNFAKYQSKELDDAKKNVDDLTGEVVCLERRVATLEANNVQLRAGNKQLCEDNLKSEIRRRELNLIFEGVADTYREDNDLLYKKFVEVLNHMEVFHGCGKDVPIVKLHRLGPISRDRNRPVLCQFLKYNGVQLVLRNRRQLPNRVFVKEDYPEEIEERRRKLRPIFNAAKSIEAYKGKCRFTVDKLVIEGQTFTVAPVNNLSQLPADLDPRKTAEKESDDVLAFFTQASPFSNFHSAPFVKDGTKYLCCEQFIQAKKAQIFNDDIAHSKIMRATSPYEMKREGKYVRNYVGQRWSQEAEKISFDGCYAKFSQNAELKQVLLETQIKELAEASPDAFWGVGLTLRDNDILNKGSWTGQNTLGKVLMRVRHELK